MRGTRLCWLLVLVACSSAKSSKPAAIIELAELTVRFEGDPIARLHADGRTESVGDSTPGKDAVFSAGPRLHADGTIELTKAGFKARVESDGDIFVVIPDQPEQLYARIAGNQIVMADEPDRGVRLEGTKVVMFDGAEPTNLIGVIDPPSMGRTALVMTAAFYIDMAITER